MAEQGGSGRVASVGKQQATSLFLNPPVSGFPFGTNFGQSPLLVPVSSQPELSQPETRSNVSSGNSQFTLNNETPPRPNVSYTPPVQQFASASLSSSSSTLFQGQAVDNSFQSPVQPNPIQSASYFPTQPLSSNPQSVAGRFSQFVYTPVHPHWMYCKEVEKKPVWVPFSLLDSLHLEEEFATKSGNEDFGNVIVQTDGGRYDVYLKDQERHAVYWEENKTPVRRATWFYRPYGSRLFIPYPEQFADKLEEEFCVAVTTNTWHRRLEFPEGDTVVIHSPTVIVHYQASSPHEWEGIPEDQAKPTVVKRGMDDFEGLEDGEGLQIDHLVFVVHGIGAFCDLKFRTLPEVVNDIRTISADLTKSHYRQHVEEGHVGRVEFIPASWHTFLHGEATGIDVKLNPITLPSIPKLRYFANDAILDVLFYTSPVYCQAIINQVCSEINRLYALFLSRNPTFHGKVSLAGHSLGSVILFDLLYHQSGTPEHPMGKSAMQQLGEQHAFDQLNDNESITTDLTQSLEQVMTLNETLEHLGMESFIEIFEREKMDMESIAMCNENDLKEMGVPLGPRKKLLAYIKEQQEKLLKEKSDKFTDIPKIDPPTPKPPLSRRHSETTINYVVGLAGTGHPYIIYPRLEFQPICFFALGSPIAMFLTVRGLDVQWEDFKLPTCPAFYNIFHPFDPVAYRIEPLLLPENYNVKPVMISHHKGRKRMHLEIKESLTRVGADLKQKLVDSLKSTWNTINDFARSHSASSAPASQGEVDAEVDRMVEEELQRQEYEAEDDLQSTVSTQDLKEEEGQMGQLNGGRRIDYVLQEKPIESFNEYLFALGSHTCYWESEDTVLLMLKEIYSSYGIYPSPNPNEPTTTAKPPLLYNPVEAQRYYAANPLPPQFNSNEPVANPYRISQAGKQQIHPSQIYLGAQPPPYLYNTDAKPRVQDNPSPPPPVMGVDPTAPVSALSAGPPPLTGFVKQSPIRK